MKALMRWILRNRNMAIGFVALLCIAALPGLKNLSIVTSARTLMVPGDPDLDFYERTLDEFGDDIVITIVLKSDDIFQEKILRSIERISSEAGRIDGVTRVISLTTVNDLRGIEEGSLEVGPLIPSIPDDRPGLLVLRERVLANRILHGEVISSDGKTAAVNLFVENPSDNFSFNQTMVDQVRSLVDGERARIGDDVEVYFVGEPLIKVDMFTQIEEDQMKLGPASGFLLAIVLLFFFRSIVALVVPLLTGILSIIVTLGFMGYMGYGINPVSAMIPILLLVIGATEEMHLLSEYGIELRKGCGKEEAIHRMAMICIVAISLTSLTTFLAFATIATNPIPLLKEFGIIASFGIFMHFVITLCVMPHYLQVCKVPRGFDHERKRGEHNQTGFIITMQRFFADTVVRHRPGIYAVYFILLGISFYGSTRVVVNTDFLGFFHKDSETRRAFQDISTHLAGAHPFFVVVDTGRAEGLTDPETLKQISRFGDFLNEEFDKAIGYTDFLKKYHQEMNGGDERFFTVPESSAEIAQYNLIMDQEVLDRFVDFDFSKTCLLVRTDVSSSMRLTAKLDRTRAYVADNMPEGLKVDYTGELLLVAKGSDVINREVLKNLSYLLVAIFIVITILFRSFEKGLISLFPNILPMAFTFGLMGYLGFPLSPATFVVAVIILGLSIDDTIHMMVRFRRIRPASESLTSAVRQTVAEEFRPVVSTSLAISLGAGVLVFSKFGSTFQFAVLSSSALIVAMFADLFVTPCLFQTFKTKEQA